MSTAIMRFAGVSLSHNPKTLTIDMKKTVRTQPLYSGVRSVPEVTGEPQTVSGEAELFGSRCFEDLNTLTAFCESNCSAVLAMPNFEAFYAVLSKLRLAATPKSDCITVEFTFTSAEKRTGTPLGRQRFAVALYGDSLWDIAYDYGVKIDELVELNPHIRDITSLTAGERVRLC